MNIFIKECRTKYEVISFFGGFVLMPESIGNVLVKTALTLVDIDLILEGGV